jgi:hypothetical protein
LFAITHPFEAPEIFVGDEPLDAEDPTTSTLATRFSVNLRADRQTDLGSDGLTENSEKQGSQVNAMRHTLWNAINTRRFGADTAKAAADAHEDDPHAIDDQDPATQTFTTLAAADQAADLRNNIIGRDLGAKVKRAPPGSDNAAGAFSLAQDVLATFHDSGLWIAQKQDDGTFKVVRQPLSDAAFAGASRKLANLNRLGLTPASADKWQAAHDARQWARQHGG